MIPVPSIGAHARKNRGLEGAPRGTPLACLQRWKRIGKGHAHIHRKEVTATIRVRETPGKTRTPSRRLRDHPTQRIHSRLPGMDDYSGPIASAFCASSLILSSRSCSDFLSPSRASLITSWARFWLV